MIEKLNAYHIDCKTDRFELLAAQVKRHAEGVFHVQRTLSHHDVEIQSLVAYDLSVIDQLWGTLKITYRAHCDGLVSITARTADDLILKYVVHYEKGVNRIQLNHAVRGEVVEYDDAYHKNISGIEESFTQHFNPDIQTSMSYQRIYSELEGLSW